MSTTTNPNARFSTYSGAPSLQPSLAPTYTTTSTTNTTLSNRPQPARASKSTPIIIAYTPSCQANQSTTTLNPTDPKQRDMKAWSQGFEKLQDERLDKQRYTMSAGKSEEVSKVALGAKLERALSRRMTSQDATFRKAQTEKSTLEVEVI